MRGNPSVRLAIAFVVFLLLGIPVWDLTRGKVPEAPASMAPSTDPAMQEVTLHVSLDFEVAPQKVSLALPTETGMTSEAFSPAVINSSNEWQVTMPKAGADFIIEAHWPNGAGKHALGVTITAAGYATVEKTFWCDGALKDVVSLRKGN